jgi:putative component of membrane protein insertase Oxa1/YidC/SpoIIIJ protein YidD
MATSLVGSFSSQVGVKIIDSYQKYISPHKGFSCAHRVLYGGESCSQYIKRVMAEEGFGTVLSKYRRRFRACQEANLVWRSQMENPETPSEQQEVDQQSPQKRPAYIDSACGDGACCCAEIGINTISLDAIDCSAVDCGACSW